MHMSDHDELGSWVGRTQDRVDWVNPNHLAAWNATLDRDDPFPREGDEVPPGFHWALFPPLARQSELGPDGHPRRGGFLPPVPLPRRMWAGSRIRFEQPLRVGSRVEQVSRIDRVEEKSGRAGRLVFVTVRHTVRSDGALALEEEQDLVYREAPRPGATEPSADPAPPGAWRREIVPDDVLLFRYSALTFNGHRIHYDHPYVTKVEGYPGLIVHGPLLAILLLDLVRRERPDAQLSAFAFRAFRPVFDIGPFCIAGKPAPDGLLLWAEDNGGALAMRAEAKLA
jgi:3-methylfumaryl-CoA hydratase